MTCRSSFSAYHSQLSTCDLASTQLPLTNRNLTSCPVRLTLPAHHLLSDQERETQQLYSINMPCLINLIKIRNTQGTRAEPYNWLIPFKLPPQHAKFPKSIHKLILELKYLSKALHVSVPKRGHRPEDNILPLNTLSLPNQLQYLLVFPLRILIAGK